MHKIILFTDSKVPIKNMGAFENSSKWELITLPHKDFRKTMKDIDDETVYFIDLESIKEENKNKELNYFLKKQEVPRCVIDRKNTINDPAEFLIKGCDYISGNFLKTGLKPLRVNKYIEFWQKQNPEPVKNKKEQINNRILKNGWDDVKIGKEYPFYMLFTEISIPPEWKTKSGDRHLNKIKKTFQRVVERGTLPYGGKIWIWSEYGGLILFPYMGNSCIPVISAIKLLLNRVIISVEDFELHTPIDIRASMHLGDTVWQTRGNTGTIVSDSINSIFHLGTKYTPPNAFDITEDVYKEMGSDIKKLFKKAGNYEDRNIFRLCKFEVIE